MTSPLYPQPLGLLADESIDPRAMALFQAGAGMMANSGPSLTPRSMGQTIGAGAQQGMNAYMQARQLNGNEQLRRLQLADLQRKMAEAEENKRIRQMLLPGVLSGHPNGVLTQAPGGTQNSGGALYNDPNRLEALGNYLAITGDAGGASIIGVADRLRKRQEETAAADSMRSKPGTLGAGVTTNSPQGQALLSGLSGDQEFDAHVLKSQNEALNSNTRLPPQPVQPERPGIYGALYSSPHVGATARNLQRQVDDTRGLSAQQILTQFNALQQQHMTASNQATAREESQAFRRELAGSQAELRREIAAGRREDQSGRERATAEHRTFTRENALSDDYERLVRDFRRKKPHFEAGEKYALGGKFNSSGDQAFVYEFVKLNDDNDKVARGDLLDVNKLGSIPERFRQWVVSAASGKELPERVRNDMFSVMNSKFGFINEQQAMIEQEFEDRARRYMLNPSNVVTRHARRSSDSPKPPGGNPGARNRESILKQYGL